MVSAEVSGESYSWRPINMAERWGNSLPPVNHEYRFKRFFWRGEERFAFYREHPSGRELVGVRHATK